MQELETITSKQLKQEKINLNYLSSGNEPSSCGYCKKNQSYSFGMVKQMMQPYTYQLMIEKGWRRCGTYYYKPNLQKSCCKLFTHRLNVSNFKIKKDQKKTIKKVIKFVFPEVKTQQKQKSMMKQEQIKPKKQKVNNKQSQIPADALNSMKTIISYILKEINTNKNTFFSFFKQQTLQNVDLEGQFSLNLLVQKIKYFKSSPNTNSLYYSNFTMLLFGSNKNLFKKQFKQNNFVKVVKEWIEMIGNNCEQNSVNFEIQLQKSGYLLFKASKKNKMEEEDKKIKEIKESIKEKKVKKQMNEAKQKMMEQSNQKKNNTIDDNIQLQISSQQIKFGEIIIKLVPAECTNQAYKLYQEYCNQIHQKQQLTKSSYNNFLCLKALNYLADVNNKDCHNNFICSWFPDRQGNKIKGKRVKNLGCFHMNYYFKKQLFGVGVVDILPDGLSSVYFFYNPKYKDLRLGVFSSLIEIEYIRWLRLSFPEFTNYYMGFYIKNNNKMSYKGDYEPFQLLCPISYQFIEVNHEVKDLITKIQNKQILSVNLSGTNQKIQDLQFHSDIGLYITQHVKLLYQGQPINLKNIRPQIMVIILTILKDLIQVWGKKLFQIFVFTF